MHRNMAVLANKVARAKTPSQKREIKEILKTLIEEQREFFKLIEDPGVKGLPLSREIFELLNSYYLMIKCCK